MYISRIDIPSQWSYIDVHEVNIDVHISVIKLNSNENTEYKKFRQLQG